MTEKPTDEEMRREAQLTHTNMALSGQDMPFDEVLQLVHTYYDSDAPDNVDRLIRKARAENRTDLDVITEYMNSLPPEKDDV